jgi:Zn-dependent protease/CBS domain-containing protein
MGMRSWSIPAGQWFGINVRVHLTFFFLLVFVWITQSASQSKTADVASLERSLAFTAIVMASVLVHELAHLAIALRGGPLPRAIILMPIGGLSLMESAREDSPITHHHNVDPGREIRVALAGPIASLALAGGVAALIRVWGLESSLLQPPLLTLANLPRSAVWINLLLAGLNLLPAFPLDGGRVLRALLSRRMDYATATRRAASLGNLFVIALMATGLWNTWFMLAGFFLFIAAQLEERTVLFQSVLENVRMEEVMLTEFSTLSPADTLEDALSKAVHTLQDDFPVVRGTDMVGVVSRHKILQALRDSGNAYVQSIMNRAYEIAGKNDTLASAFRKITSRGLTIIPVVDQERLVGIVTLQNLMHSMSVLAESKKLRRAQEEE